MKSKRTSSLTSKIILSLFVVNLVLLPGLFLGMFSIVKNTNNENFINQVRIGSYLVSNTIGSILNTYDGNNYKQIMNQIDVVIEDAMLSGEVVYFEIIKNELVMVKYTASELSGLIFIEDYQFSENNDDIYYISNQLGNIKSFNNVTIRLGYDESFLKLTMSDAYVNSIYIIIFYIISQTNRCNYNYNTLSIIFPSYCKP